MSLKHRTVIVTGAGQGLGETIARVAAESGAAVVVLDINGGAARTVANSISADGGVAEAVTCDVAAEASVEGAVTSVVKQFSRVDGLVNNAGVIGFHRLEQLDVAEWDRLVNVNLRGTFLCTKHVGRVMLEQGSGSIVNIGSVAAGAPQPNSGAYSPTKAAVVMLARQAAVEWGPANIRANSVSPGIMETPMAQGFLADPEVRQQRQSMVASRRFADPREVAAVVAWLLSDASSYVNGQNLEVDGGMMQVLLGKLPRPGTPPLR
jgi:NAD(P)-dependent dehydrogenase (short-subunit alcohol dehydrogenase family)